jgi:hypothetical protein
MATTKLAARAGMVEMRLALAPDTRFEDIVAALKTVLTIPELPGFKGCRPCLSGLDRFIVEDIVQRGMR